MTDAQHIIDTLPSAMRATVRYGQQTSTEAARGTLQAERADALYGQANNYRFSIRVKQGHLRKDIERGQRMTVDGKKYIILGWQSDQINAMTRIDLGEQYA